MNPTGRLAHIAADMYTALRPVPQGWISQPLTRGLELVLSRADDQWRLALRRADVYPSSTEIAICQRLFGVPEGSEPARLPPQRRPDPKTGYPTNYKVVEIHWREA